LHRGSEFAIGAAELLKEHVAETWIRFVDADGEHQFLNVVIHWKASEARGNIDSNGRRYRLFLLVSKDSPAAARVAELAT
jgi:hypothetical protein